MDIALSASVAVGAALPGRLFEVPGIPADDPSDIPLDSLTVVFGTNVEAGGMGGKTTGFNTMGAAKKERRAAAEEIGGLVFFCPFEPRASDKGIFSPACGRFAFAIGTEGTLALTGVSERYKAHMAEKVPEVPRARLAPPTKPRVEAGGPFGFADWMAVVTGNFRVDGNVELRTQSTWMHLMRQPEAIARDEEDGVEQEWNQANPNDADSRQQEREESRLGKLCRTRQILTTSQVGLPHQEQVVELTLFLPELIAPVFVELVLAQAFESFTLSPGLLKNPLLLVAQILPTEKFSLRILPLLPQGCLTAQGKT